MRPSRHCWAIGAGELAQNCEIISLLGRKPVQISFIRRSNVVEGNAI